MMVYACNGEMEAEGDKFNCSLHYIVKMLFAKTYNAKQNKNAWEVFKQLCIITTEASLDTTVGFREMCSISYSRQWRGWRCKLFKGWHNASQFPMTGATWCSGLLWHSDSSTCCQTMYYPNNLLVLMKVFTSYSAELCLLYFLKRVHLFLLCCHYGCLLYVEHSLPIIYTSGIFLSLELGQNEPSSVQTCSKIVSLPPFCHLIVFFNSLKCQDILNTIFSHGRSHA